MKKTLFTLALGTMIALSACNKNENLVPEQELGDANLTVTTKSVATTDANLEDVIEASDYEVSLYSGAALALGTSSASEQSMELKSYGFNNPFRYRYKLGICPNVDVEDNNGTYPKTIVLDYGDGIELINGRVIAGQVTIVISAPRTENGATHTISFQNFSVDTVRIEGESVRTFMLEEYKLQLRRQLSFTFSEGTTVDVDSERTRFWAEGMDTPYDSADDIFEITGQSTCVDSDGNAFRKEITVPLIKTGTCRFIVAGEVALSSGGEVFALINYGDGSCDNMASITNREGTEEFAIGKRVRERHQNRNTGGQ